MMRPTEPLAPLRWPMVVAWIALLIGIPFWIMVGIELGRYAVMYAVAVFA